MMRLWLAAALALGVWAESVRAAEPATPPSCAILSGSGNRAPDPAVRAVLEARLFAEPGLRFVEREEVARVVQEHNLASAEWSASASRVKLGSILPADALVFIQGIADVANGQTRIDVTESRSGVMLGSWIEENAGIRAAPDAIVARIRTAAEKTRIAPEARHLIGLLDFRGEESGLQMESAATTLSDLTIPALSRIPNVLVLDREHIEHLQTERDLTALEAKLRPSVMLLEGGLRTGGTTNEYAITVQLRRLAGGGMTNRVIVAPRADLVAARDCVVDAIAGMLGTVPAGTTSVSRTEEAAAFLRQSSLWGRWGDSARSVRAAEAAFAIESSQSNRIYLARILLGGDPEHVLRAMQLQMDYYRIQLAAVEEGTERDLLLPVLKIETQSLAQVPQSDMAREVMRLDEAAFRVRLKHYADHYEDYDRLYWETWRRRLSEDPKLLPEVLDAFGSPPSRPERYTASRLLVFGALKEGVTPDLAEKMIRHPHPFPRLIGHSFRERNGRNVANGTQALESRHAIFDIITDEMPPTHPYRQHIQDRLPWLVMDQWLARFLPADPLSNWPVAVPKSASERDILDRMRYLDSLLASGEANRFFVMEYTGQLVLEYFAWPGPRVWDGVFYHGQPTPLFDWLREIAGAGKPAEAYRLAAAAAKMTREFAFPAPWQGFLSSYGGHSQTPWLERLAAAETEFRQMLEAAGGRVQPPLPPIDTAATSTAKRTQLTKFDTRPRRGGKLFPQVPSDPLSVWSEYEYLRIPLGVSLRGDPIAFVDGNRVCVVTRCGYSGHQPGPGIHVYVFWASSGTLLAERHAAAPVRPVAADISTPEVYSVVLVGNSAYVGLSSGLLSVPLKGGEPKLLTAKDGLPGSVVKAVGSYGGLVYLGLAGEGGVLASWDPVSNGFAVVASEKAVSLKNVLDGTQFDLTAIVGDSVNRCVWLAGDGRMWQHGPATQSIVKIQHPAGDAYLPVTRAKDRKVYGGNGVSFFIPKQGVWFDLSYYHEERSTAFDGTNVVDVMLRVRERREDGRSPSVPKTCLVRRGKPPVLFTVLPDGTRFPDVVSVHASDSGVIAILKDGDAGLIRRKDMKQTYLDAECQAFSGNPDETRLLRAAAGGDQDELRRMLDAGVNVESTDGEGKTALMYAAREGQSASAGLLLDRGANGRAASFGGVSVLAHAAQRGDTGTAVRLLQMGAEPSQRSKAGMTPLLYAASAGHADMVRLLLARGANRDDVDSDGRNALGLAVECQRVSVVDCLLHAGMDPNGQSWRGMHPLVLASERDNVEILRLLCKGGANVDVLVDIGEDGERNSVTLLMKASKAGQAGLVRELLRLGARTEAVSAGGDTALIYASAMGRFEVAKALLDAGASIEAENKSKARPLLCSIGWGHPDVARLLIERKANVNCQDIEGTTPLHLATSMKQWEIVKLLLEHGADPKIKNKKGEPAMVQEK